MNMIFLSVVQREGVIFGQNAFSNIGLYWPMDKKINKAQYQFPKDFVKHTNSKHFVSKFDTILDPLVKRLGKCESRIDSREMAEEVDS